MIENHEFDGFVYEEKLKEKLCKLQTSEEVLELLKEYNYNESKEVLEVELMDLLKEFVDEEELLKVSGGKNNKKSFYNIITSLAVAGSLCMPVQGVTGVQKKEKREDKKSSYSFGLPPKEKAGLGVGVILGVGVLLEEVLRRKVFAKKDKHCRVLTDQKYEEMHKHFIKIATSPGECKLADFKKYTLRELADYMFEELIKWFQYMNKYHQISEHGYYVTKDKYDGEGKYAQSFVGTWNKYLTKLVCISLADISVRAQLKKVDEGMLKHYLTCVSQTETKTRLQTQSDEPKTWTILQYQLTNLGVPYNDANELEIKIAKDHPGMTNVMNRAVLAYVTDWEDKSEESQLAKVKNETLLSAENQLKTVTDYVESKEYKKFREGLNITA